MTSVRVDVATVFVLCFLLAVVVLWWRIEQLEAIVGSQNERLDEVVKTCAKFELAMNSRIDECQKDINNVGETMVDYLTGPKHKA